MIDECIIHVGMNKTGSSSIQKTLSKVRMKSVHYLDLGPPNHSAFFATLFGDAPEAYHVNIKRGRSREEVYKLRERFEKKLSRELSETKFNRVMVSAEDLSFPNDRQKLERLKSFLLQYCSNIKVIGYVRPPLAFIHSAFQQRVKGGMGKFNVQGCYPNYQSRFEQMDQVFGKVNVTLRKFSSESLFCGNVVKDIFSFLGESIADQDIVRANDSISVEALSVLYLHRKFGPGYGSYADATRDNQKLISFVSGFGDKKLRFSESITKPILLSQSEDIQWMEKRLGEALKEDSQKRSIDDFVISSEQELIDLGGLTVRQNIEKLVEALCSKKDFDPSIGAAIVDLVKKL